jgi:hypothetical protein
MALTPEQEPLLAFFRSELRRLLTETRLSHDRLGKRIGYSGEQIGKVVSGDRNITRELAIALDRGFPERDKLPSGAEDERGMFTRLFDEAQRVHGIYPSWFRKWVDAEQRATVLRGWEALLVPGLLQTPEYARALFRAWEIAGTDDELEKMVVGRIARQAIFGRADPPKFWAVIDETVLYRGVGGAKVMHDQLIKLAEMSERPRVAVHVIPAQTGAHIGLLGAFAVASFADDTPGIAYMETPDEGFTTKNPDTVAKLNLTFETLRNDALPCGASRDLIVKVAREQWT